MRNEHVKAVLVIAGSLLVSELFVVPMLANILNPLLANVGIAYA